MFRSKRTVGTAALAAALILAGTGPAAALEVKLTVRETGSVARGGGIVCGGVPFAKGVVKDLSKLSVAVNGKGTAAQFQSLAPWDDGSVRWALMTLAVDLPVGGTAEVLIRDRGKIAAPAAPVKVEDGAEAVKVSTGPMQFKVGKKTGDLFKSLEVDGKPLLTEAGRGLVLYTEKGEAVEAGVPAEVAVEEAGPVRAVVRVRGIFPGVHNGLLDYTVRLTAYAGGKALHVRMWLENNGAHGYKAAPEWFHFDGLAVELGLGFGAPVEASCEGATGTGKFKVYQKCPAAKWANFAYTVTGEGKELAKGARTDGVVALSGPGGKLTAAIRHFWQNYEKSIELDGEVLKLWLWPREAQWPRPEPLGGSGEGLLKNGAITRAGFNALPGGVHKGHEWVLDFSGRPAAVTGAELSAPLVAVNPEYAASTEAANALFAPASVVSGHEELDWKIRFQQNMAYNLVDRDSPGGLMFARSTGAEKGSVWFGWMDFGDICSPWGGWYGGAVTPRHLHHDWVRTVLLQYLRTGERAFLDLGTEMTRHQMEIDQNWSDRDHASVRFLMRGEASPSEVHTGGGNDGVGAMPGPEQNWISGIVLYYLLTGDPKARECALRNYQGIQDRTIRRLKAGPSDDIYLYGSFLTLRNLLSLHSMTGEKQYLDDIGAVLSGHLLPRFTKCGPFLFEPRLEIRGQEYHRLGEQFCYGLLALGEYHYRTGDPRVGKVLAEACAAEFPETYFEAPLFLSDLYGYVGIVRGDAGLAERGMDSFADAFPESRKPALFHPGELDWTALAAARLRAGSLLQYIAWKGRTSGRWSPAEVAARGLIIAPPARLPEATDADLTPNEDGTLVLDAKAFALKDCDVQELTGALGGKAVLLRQYTSAATREVPLKTGNYELVLHCYAPGEGRDAFYVFVDGARTRIGPDNWRAVLPTKPVPFTVTRDKTVTVQFTASEKNGMSVDRVVIRPVKKAP